MSLLDLITRRNTASLLAVLLALGASGCSGLLGLLPEPVHVDRIRTAAEQEYRRCDAEPIDPRVFGSGVVESVTPLYRYVQTGSNREARLHGAELRLHPLPGMTAELMMRTLSCRSARLVLGRVEGSPNEPYWLPDGWVKIDVRSDDGSFVVALEGEDLPEAKDVLARAQAFRAAQ
jgi:hypothetical protein